MRFGLFLLLFVLIIGIGSVAPIIAQSDTIITLAVDEWMQTTFTPRVFEDFYAQHPGVKVVVVNPPQGNYYSPAAYVPEDHFAGVERLAAMADVLLIQEYQLGIEATRTGAFLDMSPLIATDTSLNTDDFFPSIWQSFQWDGGVWAIPASSSFSLIIYNAAAFDEAGVPYPDESWTLTDYLNAARELTQYADDGSVAVPGMMAWDVGRLYVALTGEHFYDDSTGQVSPRFNTPQLADFLVMMADAQREKIINDTGGGNIDYNRVPMLVDSAWRMSQGSMVPGSDANARWQASLLPGGRALLNNVQAFAVSAGTDQPELAYDLAVYLSGNIETVNRLFGDTPARRSLVGVQPDDPNYAIIRPSVPEDVQPILDAALTNALSLSATLFADYVNMAFNEMFNPETPVDASSALQDAEASAVGNLQTAESMRPVMGNIIVVTPVPTPVLAQNEISLKFQMQVSMSPMPNRDQWERIAQEFADSDPQVGYVELMTSFNPDQNAVPDCMYDEFDGRIANLDVNAPTLLSLDPLINADPMFDRGDMLPGIMDQVTRDGRVWGYPLVIFPEVLLYNSDLFTEANVPLPENGWTVNDFNDALLAVGALPDAQPVFVPQGNNNYILMLIAAYGALPYDVRTDPPTLNIADPATIEAMRDVLNLAKDGYINYQQLAVFGGGGGGAFGSPIYTDRLSATSWILQNRLNQDMPEFAPYRMTTYPSGTTYSPMSYSVGTAFIDVNTPYAESCYNWISMIGQHPELFTGMPVRRTQMSDPAVVANLGDEATAIYNQYDQLLQSPSALVMGNFLGSSSYRGAYVEQLWLFGVFDDYVLDNADLETELAQYETNVATYRQCLEDVPDFSTLGENPTEEETQTLFRDFASCATAIDPDMAAIFGLN